MMAAPLLWRNVRRVSSQHHSDQVVPGAGHTVPDQTAVRALLREFKQMKGAASTGYRTILGYYADGHDIRVNYYSNPAVMS